MVESELSVRYEDGIIIADYGHTLVIHPEQSWDLLRLAAPLVQNYTGPFRVMVLAGSISLLFGEFRTFLRAPEVAEVTAALAIVTPACVTQYFFDEAIRQSGNVSYPLRTFERTSDAKAWLHTVV